MKALASLVLAITALVASASVPSPAETPSVLTVTNAWGKWVYISFHAGAQSKGEMAVSGAKVVWTFPGDVTGIVYADVKGHNSDEKTNACLASLPVTIKAGHTVNLRVDAENNPIVGRLKIDCAIVAHP
jgi:hypothetical protein